MKNLKRAALPLVLALTSVSAAAHAAAASQWEGLLPVGQTQKAELNFSFGSVDVSVGEKKYVVAGSKDQKLRLYELTSSGLVPVGAPVAFTIPQGFDARFVQSNYFAPSVAKVNGKTVVAATLSLSHDRGSVELFELTPAGLSRVGPPVLLNGRAYSTSVATVGGKSVLLVAADQLRSFEITATGMRALGAPMLLKGSAFRPMVFSQIGADVIGALTTKSVAGMEVELVRITSSGISRLSSIALPGQDSGHEDPRFTTVGSERFMIVPSASCRIHLIKMASNGSSLSIAGELRSAPQRCLSWITLAEAGGRAFLAVAQTSGGAGPTPGGIDVFEVKSSGFSKIGETTPVREVTLGWTPAWTQSGGKLLLTQASRDGEISLYELTARGLVQRDTLQIAGTVHTHTFTIDQESYLLIGTKPGELQLFRISVSGLEPVSERVSLGANTEPLRFSTVRMGSNTFLKVISIGGAISIFRSN